MKVVALCLLLAAVFAKKQYQPSEKVLDQMMQIEIHRYQHMFGFDTK